MMDTYSERNIRQRYYKHGHVSLQFTKDEQFQKLYNTLHSIYTNKIKDGFNLEMAPDKKNPRSDLRPNTALYDPIFIDILYKQNIFQKLKEVTGLDLFLGNIKIRVNHSNKKGYGTWHRDSNFYRGKSKGNMPPVINLHYYPNFEEAPEPALRVWDESHRKQTDSLLLDRATTIIKKPLEIMTDNNSYIVVETGLLHKVPPTSYKKGSLRLMYNFCEKFQLENFSSVGTEAQQAMKKR